LVFDNTRERSKFLHFSAVKAVTTREFSKTYLWMQSSMEGVTLLNSDFWVSAIIR
jgi:hypothetical protein